MLISRTANRLAMPAEPSQKKCQTQCDERRARREDAIEMLTAGLISPVQAYQELHPGVTPAQAKRAIAEIKAPTVAADAPEATDD